MKQLNVMQHERQANTFVNSYVKSPIYSMDWIFTAGVQERNSNLSVAIVHYYDKCTPVDMNRASYLNVSLGI